MNQQHPDDEQPEVDENGLEWHSVDYRTAPRDVVPQEKVDPETQRAAMADLARRHANGERFWLVPNEQLVFDAEGRPASYRQPSGAEITAFASEFQRPHNDEEDPP